jgi:hypothetical protein
VKKIKWKHVFGSDFLYVFGKLSKQSKDLSTKNDSHTNFSKSSDSEYGG